MTVGAGDAGDFSWLRLIFAFATVLGLMGIMALVLKYIGTRGLTLPGMGIGGAARVKRMQIIESLPIDTRRRFVIMRCDGREHLLLLTAQGDIVVEANLPSVPSVSSPA